MRSGTESTGVRLDRFRSVADREHAPRVSIIRYGPDDIEAIEPGTPDSLRSVVVPGKVTWIDVQGLGDENLLRGIGDAFSLHALALEDIVNAPSARKQKNSRRLARTCAIPSTTAISSPRSLIRTANSSMD
jgi:Mg2+ and Co2+ transporter CorA